MNHHKNLTLICINEAQHLNTCGYWYLVQENHAALTAFRTKAALTAWLDLLDLTVDGVIPDEKGEYAWMYIKGEYIEKCVPNITGLPGEHIYQLSNGSYTTGVLSTENEIKTISYTGPNGNRFVHDYFDALNQIQSGNFYLRVQP